LEPFFDTEIKLYLYVTKKISYLFAMLFYIAVFKTS